MYVCVNVCGGKGVYPTVPSDDDDDDDLNGDSEGMRRED